MGQLNGRWAVRGAAMVAALALVVPVATRAALASDAELVTEARKTLAVFQKNDPALAKFAARSAGYAVFPTITKGAIGVGGAHGTGVLFVKGKAMGKASLTQVTIGAQLGGQEYSEVIFFETARAVADFEKGALDGGAVHWRRWRWVGGLGSRLGRGRLCVRHGTEDVCGDLAPVSI